MNISSLTDNEIIQYLEQPRETGLSGEYEFDIEFDTGSENITLAEFKYNMSKGDLYLDEYMFEKGDWVSIGGLWTAVAGDFSDEGARVYVPYKNLNF